MLHKSRPGTSEPRKNLCFYFFFFFFNIIISGLKFDIEHIELKIYCKSDPHTVFFVFFLFIPPCEGDVCSDFRLSIAI